jgi:hypothetical protein
MSGTSAATASALTAERFVLSNHPTLDPDELRSLAESDNPAAPVARAALAVIDGEGSTAKVSPPKRSREATGD